MTQEIEREKELATKKNKRPEWLQFLSMREIKRNLSLMDRIIVILVVILLVIGLVSVASAVMYQADPLRSIITQFLAVFIGIIAIITMQLIPYNLFENIKIIAFSMGLMAIVLGFVVVVGRVISGASSWVEFVGVSVQPSEFVKLLSILLVSWMNAFMDREVLLEKERNTRFFLKSLYALLFINLFFILLQPDFGMMLIISSTLFMIFMLTRLSLKTNLLAYGVVILTYILVSVFGAQFSDWLISKNYHILSRIAAFTDPFSYATDAGYQLIQSLVAFSRGGWFGVGLGQGVSKNGTLPVIESDFILANIGEETGLLGVSILLIVFFALVVVLYQRAALSTNLYRKSVLIGIASVLWVQAVINIGGVIAILPLTGVTLPFISQGGTSMVLSLAMIGVALRLIVEDKKTPNINLVYTRKKGDA